MGKKLCTVGAKVDSLTGDCGDIDPGNTHRSFGLCAMPTPTVHLQKPGKRFEIAP